MEEQLPGAYEARHLLNRMPETYVADILMGGQWTDAPYVRFLAYIARFTY